jgi:hypothetical protein
VTRRTSDVSRFVLLRNAWLRALLVLPLWVVRYYVQGQDPVPPTLSTIGLDVLLFAGHFWSTGPAMLADPDFPSRSKPSAHLWTGVVVAAFFLGRDVVLYLRGEPL